MSHENKVVWTEGMFLNPQHFQQQERYLERYIAGRTLNTELKNWGFTRLEIDQQLLKLNKFAVLRAEGIFPDGTPFSIPDIDPAPPVLDIPIPSHDLAIALALPVQRSGAIDVVEAEIDSQAKEDSNGASALGSAEADSARFAMSEFSVRDNASENQSGYPVKVGLLRTRLLAGDADRSGFVSLGVVIVKEAVEGRAVELDDGFIPSQLSISASEHLPRFLNELSGLLHQRAESIAVRLGDVKRGATAEVSDYMTLQFLNRVEVEVAHLARSYERHPRDIYEKLLAIDAELSTFVSERKRPRAVAAYQHEDLAASFAGLTDSLRKGLSKVYEQTAINLAMTERKYGIRVSEISDRSLLDSAQFVMAVAADIDEEAVRQRFPAQTKLGPVERIRQLVNAAMPGIAMRALPVAPRQIPFRSGYSYFELQQHGPLWAELSQSGGFALHVAGDFPNLRIEFWAIRQS